MPGLVFLRIIISSDGDVQLANRIMDSAKFIVSPGLEDDYLPNFMVFISGVT